MIGLFNCCTPTINSTSTRRECVDTRTKWKRQATKTYRGWSRKSSVPVFEDELSIIVMPDNGELNSSRTGFDPIKRLNVVCALVHCKSCFSCVDVRGSHIGIYRLICNSWTITDTSEWKPIIGGWNMFRQLIVAVPTSSCNICPMDGGFLIPTPAHVNKEICAISRAFIVIWFFVFLTVTDAKRPRTL